MSLLRIYCPLTETPQRCLWALVNESGEPVTGEGSLAQLPPHAARVQLVVPAAQVLITRGRVPRKARRGAGPVLAFAVEERTAGEPDANQVSWLGAVRDGDVPAAHDSGVLAANDSDVLAVLNKPGLMRWRDALAAVGIRDCEIQCETLLLPWTPGEWTLVWNGRDGFVRTGEFEGAATDCGGPAAPPLSLHLLLEEARTAGTAPASIALHTDANGVAPDVEAWARELGVTLRLAGNWDWRTAPASAGIALAQEQPRWRAFAGAAPRLQSAAWLLGAALAIHAIALAIDWTVLASEQRNLRARMETRFRTAFPATIAVADPVLQMRRKLAEARHAAGLPDSGDFLPMLAQVAAASKSFPAGAMRLLSYENGRMTLELATTDDAGLRLAVEQLRQTGLRAEAAGPGHITVRAS